MTGVAVALILAGWNGYLLVYAYGARGLVPAIPVGLFAAAGVLAVRGMVRAAARRRGADV